MLVFLSLFVLATFGRRCCRRRRRRCCCWFVIITDSLSDICRRHLLLSAARFSAGSSLLLFVFASAPHVAHLWPIVQALTHSSEDTDTDTQSDRRRCMHREIHTYTHLSTGHRAYFAVVCPRQYSLCCLALLTSEQQQPFLASVEGNHVVTTIRVTAKWKRRQRCCHLLTLNLEEHEVRDCLCWLAFYSNRRNNGLCATHTNLFAFGLTL